MNPVLLVVLFVVSAVLGAIIAAFSAKGWLALILALAACVIAMVNVAGGFALTHKMLSSFVKKGAKKEDA